MRIMLGLLFCLLFTFPATAKLVEKAWWQQGQDHYFAELFVEAGRWQLNTYRVAPGRLQEKYFEKEFESKLSAIEFWQAYTSQFQVQEDSMTSFAKARSRFVTSESRSVLWYAEKEWNDHWEKKYSKWMRKDFSENFFSQHNMATDCADAAIATRWIFARIHKLPMGIALTGSGVLFSHESMKKEWLSLPTADKWHEDQRFLTAVDYVMDHSYTHSLSKDSYPVKISHDGLDEGAFLLSLDGESGHTQLVSETSYSDSSKPPAFLLSSTVPKIVRPLVKELMLFLSPPESGRSGFRKLRWLVRGSSGWVQKPGVAHSLYSEEQFSKDFMQDGEEYYEAIYRHLNVDFRPDIIFSVALGDLTQSFAARIPVIEEGYEFCKNTDCSPGTQNWENWSTPSRDKRLRLKVVETNKLYLQLVETKADLKDVFSAKKKQTVWNISGAQFNLGQLMMVMDFGIASHDPKDSIAKRWGLSGRGVAEVMAKRLQKVVVEREKKIGQGRSPQCSSYCAPGTEKFTEASSKAIDEKIAKLVSAELKYCGQFSDESCSELSRGLERVKINALGKSQSLREFFGLAPWFNPDPNTDYSVRWGGNSNKVRVTRMVDLSKGFRIFSDGTALVGTDMVWDSLTGQEVMAPKNSSLEAHPLGVPLVFGIKKEGQGEYSFIHFFEGSFHIHPFSGKFESNPKLTWLGKRHFIFGQEGNFRLFQVEKASVSLLRELSPTSSLNLVQDELAIPFLLESIDSENHRLSYEKSGKMRQVDVAKTFSVNQLWSIHSLRDEQFFVLTSVGTYHYDLERKGFYKTEFQLPLDEQILYTSTQGAVISVVGENLEKREGKPRKYSKTSLWTLSKDMALMDSLSVENGYIFSMGEYGGEEFFLRPSETPNRRDYFKLAGGQLKDSVMNDKNSWGYRGNYLHFLDVSRFVTVRAHFDGTIIGNFGKGQFVNFCYFICDPGGDEFLTIHIETEINGSGAYVYKWTGQIESEPKAFFYGGYFTNFFQSVLAGFNQSQPGHIARGNLLRYSEDVAVYFEE